MIAELEHAIRQRAHRIWEEEGRPDGRADAHWRKASAEVTAAHAPKAKAPARKAATKAPAAPAAAPKRRKPAAKVQAADQA